MKYPIILLIIIVAFAESYVTPWMNPWHIPLSLMAGLLVAIVAIKLDYWWVAILGGGMLDLTSTSVFGIHTAICLAATYIVIWIKQKHPNRIFLMATTLSFAISILNTIVQGNTKDIFSHTIDWVTILVVQGLTAAFVTCLSLTSLKWIDTKDSDYEHRTILR